MAIYLDLAGLLNFTVDFLLISGTNRITGGTYNLGRFFLAALVGGIYGAMCLLPGFSFLTSFLWKLIFLVIITVLAFGLCRGAIRRGILFCLLSMALGGAAAAGGSPSFWGIICAGIGICILCRVGFTGADGEQKILPCIMTYGGNCVETKALMDTGNTLRDPITGERVIVAGAEMGRKLTGLSSEELKDPVRVMKLLPRGRLVPYRAVGQPEGLLPAVRVDLAVIGRWRGSPLVAFAADELGSEYGVLTGGKLT